MTFGVGFVINKKLRNDLKATQDRLQEADAKLAKLPETIAAAVEKTLVQALAPPNSAGSTDQPARVRWLDVTGDGRPELLVEHGAGAHSALLKIFGKLGPSGDFEEIGELFTDHGSFAVSDFDGDGRTEIRAVLTDSGAWREPSGEQPGHSMAAAPVVEHIWRWNGTGFESCLGRRWDPLSEIQPSWFDDMLKEQEAWNGG